MKKIIPIYIHTKGNSMYYWSIYLFFVLFSPWSLHTTHSADVSCGLFLGAPFLCQKDHGENSHNWHLIQYQRELSRGQKHSLSLSIHLLQINHILSLWVFQKIVSTYVILNIYWDQMDYPIGLITFDITIYISIF